MQSVFVHYNHPSTFSAGEIIEQGAFTFPSITRPLLHLSLVIDYLASSSSFLDGGLLKALSTHNINEKAGSNLTTRSLRALPPWKSNSAHYAFYARTILFLLSISNPLSHSLLLYISLFSTWSRAVLAVQMDRQFFLQRIIRNSSN